MRHLLPQTQWHLMLWHDAWQERTGEAHDAEQRRQYAARQLADLQRLAAEEASTSAHLRDQLSKAKAATPAAVSMPQVCPGTA